MGKWSQRACPWCSYKLGSYKKKECNDNDDDNYDDNDRDDYDNSDNYNGSDDSNDVTMRNTTMKIVNPCESNDDDEDNNDDFDVEDAHWHWSMARTSMIGRTKE